ncbi:MAG: phosphoribosylglycinamide formyltransferase [Pseudonocardiales bacterium]
MSARPVRIVVLASGTGTTLQAILEAAADPDDFGGQVVAAGTDVKGCAAMERAEAHGIPTFAVQLRDFADRAAWNDALAEAIAGFQPDLVVLAGFMRILAPDVVRRFRIVNTHPALLPAFPGAHAVRDALAAGAARTGVTVHWVDEGIDTGAVIAQLEVPMMAGDDEGTLTARVQAAEKPFYVEAVHQLCQEIQ